MRLTSTGLGIGTTAPWSKLSVYGSGSQRIAVTTPTGGASIAALDLSPALSAGEAVTLDPQARIYAVDDNYSASIIFANKAKGSSSNSLQTRMTLDANGSLAVGGTTVVTNNGGITATTTSSGSVQATLAMRNAGTGNGSGTTLAFRGVTNTGAENDYAYLSMVADNTTALTGSIRFSTGSGSSPVERARIDSSGNLLVGTTSGIAKLHVLADAAAVDPVTISNSDSGTGSQYAIVFRRNTSTIVGSIQTTNTLTSYNVSSDYRLKNTIAPMTGALAKVALLKPVTYKWNADGSDGEGFIAHELAEVVPHAVTGDKDALDKDGNPKYQGIDVSFLVATLTAAIQEQQALITQLQADVATLKGN
jgi:hypothetical protein